MVSIFYFFFPCQYDTAKNARYRVATYIMGWMLRRRVIQRHILYGIGGPSDLGAKISPLGGEHGETGEKSAIAEFELTQGIAHIASAICAVRTNGHIRQEGRKRGR